MSQTYETILEPHVRGRTFRRIVTLTSPWTGATFTSDVKFTLRPEIPASGIGDDQDAIAQATVSGGEITFVDDVGTIVIAPRRQRGWPTGLLYWDLTGVISSTEIHTIDSGTIEIVGAVTKST